jgi:hypothetical protein
MRLLAAKSVWIVKILFRGIFRELGRELGRADISKPGRRSLKPENPRKS